ncbi:peptidoglycan recognition protein family protein [Flaviflexus massiliensis]|uniref:peptidoglycan recognition protein family protein n=1 Tax=Flaviflexus massiliensis TaxID=1522309 RepID=UPI0009E8591E|nr:peptidoglycan recognition protein [Flaviflexus massiliensis]
MKFRSAALVTILLATPTLAIADTPNGVTVIDLHSAPQTDQSSLSPATGEQSSSLRTMGAVDGYEILTQPLEADEFFVAGVTWEGTAPDGVDIRVLENGAWSDWYALELEIGEGGNDGTEAFIAGGAEGVQARIAGASLPSELNLVLTSGNGGEAVEETAPEAAAVAPASGTDAAESINADEVGPEKLMSTGPEGISEDAVAQPRTMSVQSTAKVPAPAVVSRAEWGETRVPPAWTPQYAKLGGAVIHHTAGTNNYTQAQAPGVVRSVHDYHTYDSGRGWDDIGYNYLVDKYGTIYEGRYGTLLSTGDQMVVGGHAAPANTGSMGISVMGNYTGSVQPTQASITSIENIIAWKFSEAGVNPKGTWTFYNSRTGTNQTVNAILGHRDVSSTVCPGNIYPLLSNIRNNVQTKIDSAGKPVRGDNDLVLYRTNDFSPISTDIQYFGKTGDEFYVGNVLGYGDLPFTRRGNLFTFATGPTSPTSTQKYTIGTVGQQVFTGDLDGDGGESLILRTGNRFDIYDNPAVNKPTRSINYGRSGDEVFVFDWDGDGNDEIAVRRGNAFHLKWMVTSGNADKVINYGRVGDEVYVGNWNGGSIDTITVRRGNTYHMSYSNVSGNADRKFNYGKATDNVVVGDWDRDGKDGIGVVRDLTK